MWRNSNTLNSDFNAYPDQTILAKKLLQIPNAAKRDVRESELSIDMGSYASELFAREHGLKEIDVHSHI